MSRKPIWFPACAGMTEDKTGMTEWGGMMERGGFRNSPISSSYRRTPVSRKHSGIFSQHDTAIIPILDSGLRRNDGR
ncbi:MAG: hypothetical protein COX19_12195 [Desulfobacterales bacterium CG23_combo_of_CG06-09_8_20_14_all_51_8]|nr:MAG: hypothetical protein COX19_12195 [Desulfobacterales bacterium CG23_combo_of_CG06-09_8_20_14_all_51_8]